MFFDLKRNKILERQFKILKLSCLMGTGLKILVAKSQFSVALGTSWLQLWTLIGHCESKVSCPRTEHNVPSQGLNLEHLISR